jgi:SEC-C motif-containing protein
MPVNQKCFCGSNKDFLSCCQPFIDRNVNQEVNQQTFPITPEQLMRSRFSAYAVGNAQYIYDTYAKTSKASQSVKEISDWSKACTWIALQIHSVKNSGTKTTESSEQFVEFSAFYITNDILCELRENSRFVLECITGEGSSENESQDLQWCYIDGDIIEHCELKTIKRKDLCPCNNYSTAWTIKKGKKFKQCCGS